MDIPKRERRGPRGRRGNALVEGALVILPMFAMLFAIFDYGVVMFLQGTFKNAVREGVRFAITQRTLPGMGHIDSIKAVVQQNSIGFLAGPTGLSKIGVQFYRPVVSGSGSTSTATLVSVMSNAGGNVVEVTIDNFVWGWMAPLERSNASPMTLSARSSDRLEQPRQGVPPPL